MSRSPREHPRYAHEAAVTLYVDGIEHIGRTMNVSRGGMCADLAEPIPLGSDVLIDLQLVFEDENQSEPLRLPSRVVWCTSVDEAHQVGLAFRPLDAELGDYLTMFLRYLEREPGEQAAAAPTQRIRRPVDELFG